MLSGVRLRVVPLASILPHEIADPGRETRIERRIAEEGVLRDPLLVGAVADVEGLVLLDGTNRHAALGRLGLQSAMVQIIDYADPGAAQLRTWCHAAPHSPEWLASEADRIEGLNVEILSPLGAQDALSSPGTLAALLGPHARYGVNSVMGEPARRVEALRAFVDLYERQMTRVDCDEDAIEERVRTLPSIGTDATLIAFPHMTRGRVVAMAMEGLRIPAGITRHIILGGRALRVNLPLDILSLEDEEHANEALARHLAVLHPRVYGEPTVLFDS